AEPGGRSSRWSAWTRTVSVAIGLFRGSVSVPNMRVRVLVIMFVLLGLAACDGGSETSTLPSPPGADSSVPAAPASTAVASTVSPSSTTTDASDTTGSSVPDTTLPALQGLEYTTVAEAGFPIVLTARPGDPFALA